MSHEALILIVAIVNLAVALFNLWRAHRNEEVAKTNMAVAGLNEHDARRNMEQAACNAANAMVNVQVAKDLDAAWKRFQAMVTTHWLVQKSLSRDPEDD